MLRHLSTLLILLFIAPDTQAFLPIGQFDEAQLLPILKETLYKTLGLKHVPDFLKEAKKSVEISARQKAAIATLEFDPSPCAEEHLAWDDEWFQIHPYNNPYFFKVHFKHNWDLLWKNADKERKARTCLFLREAAKILNVGWRSGKDGQPTLLPKMLEWVDWMGMHHPYGPGHPYYGDGHSNNNPSWKKGCMMMGAHYRLTNPSVIKNMGLRDYTLEDYHIELKAQGKSVWNDQKLQHWLDFMLDHEGQCVITPELDIQPGISLLRSGEGFALMESNAKPWIDAKKCAKLSRYPKYNEVSVEIDTYLIKLYDFFYGLWETLAPLNGTGPDMNYLYLWHTSNNNRKFPLENRLEAHYADSEHEYLPENPFLPYPNRYLYWDENSQEYKHSNFAIGMARYGMTTEKDYVPYYDPETATPANSTIYSYWNWGKNTFTSGKFGTIEWGHMIHGIIYYIGSRLVIAMGPFTGKYAGSYFGDYEVNAGNRSWPSYEDGVQYGGNSSWPLTWPMQTDFARHSQTVMFQSSNKTIEEQLAIWNDQEWMKGGDNSICGDFEVPEPWTNLMDLMPFVGKYAKYWWIAGMTSTTMPKIHKDQGCRYRLFAEKAGTIAFHKELGFPHEVALARAILFDTQCYRSMKAGMDITNLVFMLLGTNLFVHLLVMIILAWLTLKITIKLLLMLGFDIVKLGKMIDDREFYSKNNAGETMNAIWPSAHPGKTNHEDYAWDMPEVLQRPQGGEYVYHTDIFLMSANDMVNKPVRTAPFPTAQSYLDMGHAKGSREDIQSLVALCFIVCIYGYILFTVGRYRQVWEQS